MTVERVPLHCTLTPAEVLRRLRDEPWPFALSGSWAGGGAIVGASPRHVAGPDADPFATLDSQPTLTNAEEHRDGTVGGGWFGWLGYRLGRRIEELPPGPSRPAPLPDFQLAYYDHVLRLDAAGQWWFEALVSEERRAALQRRRAELQDRLATPAATDPYTPPPPFVLAEHDADAHADAVARCRRRIVAGEIYQANICLRLETSCEDDITTLFAQAEPRISPPYAAAFSTPDGGILSLSPELFLRRLGRQVTTAPIKGTIRRPSDPALAAATLHRLRDSHKDAAEHVMIVDLMRNDLGRVCTYGSVQAPSRPDIEPHPGLWHLVSYVHGRLHPNASDGDLLRATFPPGSVTGAPKVQAMRVISELEQTGRELYTGAVGFASPLAGLELSVAIRTFELSGGRLWLGVGGGIVADSDPRRELEEALVKARPIAAAIGTRVCTEARGARASTTRTRNDRRTAVRGASLESADAWLAERELLGMHFGLERMRRLMCALGDPQRRFRSVHIVGTNGKSSTVRMIAAILERHGLRTGAYLSPHLESFVERIEIGERMISDQRFATAIAHVARAASSVDIGGDRVTQFEALTAAAYLAFAEDAVEVAVVEAGLGGRFDATSVIESDVQVLTNVGLEHTALLGSTHAEIAAEKLAVVPPNGNLVLGAGLHDDALRAARETITGTGASLTIAPAAPSADPAVAGAFQRRNFALAEAAAAAFAGRLDPARVAQAAASVRSPGRFEIIGRSPLIVMDGAHNPDGIRALIDALEHMPLAAGALHRGELVVTLSILKDKDAEGIVNLLLPFCRTFIATSNSSLRAQPAHSLASLIRRLGGHVAAVEPDPVRALAEARLRAGADGVALATGSIALIGDLVVARARAAVRAA